MKFPPKTTLIKLSESFRVEFFANGPSQKGWEGHYLECPHCLNLLLKSGDHGCECGNVFIDGGMFRVIVEDGNENLIKTYYAYKK